MSEALGCTGVWKRFGAVVANRCRVVDLTKKVAAGL